MPERQRRLVWAGVKGTHDELDANLAAGDAAHGSLSGRTVAPGPGAVGLMGMQEALARPKG